MAEAKVRVCLGQRYKEKYRSLIMNTPIVVTKRLEQMSIFKKTRQEFMDMIVRSNKTRKQCLEAIHQAIHSESRPKSLYFANNQKKKPERRRVKNLLNYNALVMKCNFLNGLPETLPVEKIFKFNILYKNTIEYYRIANNKVLTSYVSVKAKPIIEDNDDKYLETHVNDTFCCWLKRNHVVKILKNDYDLPEPIVNFMKQFHSCKYKCDCCVDCIKQYNEPHSMFSENNTIELDEDSLHLSVLKQEKFKSKYLLLSNHKPDMNNVIKRTSYPDVNLLNTICNETSVVNKALLYKKLVDKRQILSCATKNILVNAEKVIRANLDSDYLKNCIIEIYYPDQYLFERTEIVELGSNGDVLIHAKKPGKHAVDKLGYIINHEKLVIQVKFCCDFEKEKAFKILGKNRILQNTLLYLNRVYKMSRARQNYKYLCSCIYARRNTINLNPISPRIETTKNVHNDAPKEQNYTSVAVSSKVEKSIDPSLIPYLSDLKSEITYNVKKLPYFSQKGNTETNPPIPIDNELESSVQRPICSISNVHTLTESNQNTKKKWQLPKQQIDIDTRISNLSNELETTNKSLSESDSSKFFLHNIITSTIQNQLNNPVKNSLVRHVNLMIEELSKKYENFKLYLDENKRVTATIRTDKKISDDEMKTLQIIIFKTQNLVNEHNITSNEALTHMLSSLPTTVYAVNFFDSKFDNNGTGSKNISNLAPKSFTLKPSESDVGVIPQCKPDSQNNTIKHVDFIVAKTSSILKTNSLEPTNASNTTENKTVTKVPIKRLKQTTIQQSNKKIINKPNTIEQNSTITQILPPLTPITKVSMPQNVATRSPVILNSMNNSQQIDNEEIKTENSASDPCIHLVEPTQTFTNSNIAGIVIPLNGVQSQPRLLNTVPNPNAWISDNSPSPYIQAPIPDSYVVVPQSTSIQNSVIQTATYSVPMQVPVLGSDNLTFIPQMQTTPYLVINPLTDSFGNSINCTTNVGIQQNPNCFTNTNLMQNTNVLQNTNVFQNSNVFQNTNLLQNANLFQNTNVLQNANILQNTNVLHNNVIQNTNLLQNSHVLQNTNVLPSYNKSPQLRFVTPPLETKQVQGDASITMWAIAPKSKKIVKTQIQNTEQQHMAVSNAKRTINESVDGNEVLDFFGNVKKIKITKN